MCKEVLLEVLLFIIHVIILELGVGGGYGMERGVSDLNMRGGEFMGWKGVFKI